MSAENPTNIGIVLKSLGRHREAAASFGRALTYKPDDPSARFALAFLYLALGEFTLGWPLYEARFDVPALGNPARHFSAPRWNGEPLEGKTLLVHAEQGLGDVIQFCRYLPLLAAQGVSVAFEVMPSLKALLRTLPPAISFVGRGERMIDFSADLDCGADAFLDTAAVMAGLDLVISSDTSVAHLAGALGRPVWTVLAASPEWRWGLERSDSPWYPSMRLFRQTTDGDWKVVVAAIAQALQAHASRPAASV